MTRRRFFAPVNAFSSGRQTVTLLSDEARYLRDVLRLHVGDEVSVFDGEGREFQCTIAESTRSSAELNVISEIVPAKPESHLHLTLAVALLKGDKFDLVVQKVTELGGARIVPVITDRSDVRLEPGQDLTKRVERWQRIALEAAKQSGRALVPEVSEPVSFADCVSNATEPLRIIFSERDGGSLEPALQDCRASEVVVLVGSEGGWTDRELESARDAGWKIVTLGGRTLRAETAAIVVVALLQNHFGDLR